MQTSLSKFIKNKSDQYPRYFHYDGHDAIFTTEQPPNSKILMQIKWKFTGKFLNLTIDSTINSNQTNNKIEKPAEKRSTEKQSIEKQSPEPSEKQKKLPAIQLKLVRPKPNTIHHPSDYQIKYQAIDNYYHDPHDEIVAILKSHLQKAIRLRKADQAIATIYHLSELAPIELLRRLPIIMIEDVHLFASFPLLIWGMIYYSSLDSQKNSSRLSPKFSNVKAHQTQISDEWFTFLIHVTVQLCQSHHFDDLATPIQHQPSQTNPDQPPPEKDQLAFTDLDYQVLTNEQKSILFALQLRKSYGGMKGDQVLLDETTRVWYRRFRLKNQNQNQNQTELSLQLFTKKLTFKKQLQAKIALDPQMFINTAIDFHCCPQLIPYLTRKYPEYNEQQIKTCIWECQSRLNPRITNQHPSEESAKIWEQIKNYATNFVDNKKEWFFLHLTDPLEEVLLDD